ncbi:hypothetical protein H5410_016744 [Solanum commersonii]|uniref:Uncharacterized protein n=1 Tax=Solanum commersonii TaxID=4109 RepID=A0A9J5ZXE8_SOLCO|nr:hypothetical protein H5410_016744 [Solanum commersonii]
MLYFDYSEHFSVDLPINTKPLDLFKRNFLKWFRLPRKPNLLMAYLLYLRKEWISLEKVSLGDFCTQFGLPNASKSTNQETSKSIS